MVINALERSPPEALPMSDDLPPPNTRRWVVRRKAAVVTAVRSGRIILEEVLQRYALTAANCRQALGRVKIILIYVKQVTLRRQCKRYIRQS
jgi:hypothetical protein